MSRPLGLSHDEVRRRVAHHVTVLLTPEESAELAEWLDGQRAKRSRGEYMDSDVIADDYSYAAAWGRHTVDPVGAVEIAERLGVARATVDQWRQRRILPAPRWTVGGRPAWEWPQIEQWAKVTGRLAG